jgi:hypothetical protein
VAIIGAGAGAWMLIDHLFASDYPDSNCRKEA